MLVHHPLPKAISSTRCIQLYQTPHDVIVGASSIASTSASAVSEAIVTASTVASTQVATGSFFRLFLAFLAGGLFFSTVISAVATCYAMGLDNVQRILSTVSIVSGKIWETFLTGLKASKAVLLGEKYEKRWNWKSAWQTLKQELQQTKKLAVEGVQAIREEGKLYSAAVGAPGLIPVQYLTNNLMPLTSTILQDAAKNALIDLSTKTFRKIVLNKFTAGKKPPTFKAARFFDVENSIAFDYDLEWNSELEAILQVYATPLLGLARIPIKLKNLKFDGTVRIILTPIIDQAPGYGAMLLSFPSAPKINIDLEVFGGEITKLPFLEKEIMNQIKKSVAEDMTWPRRSVIPSQIEINNSKRLALTAQELASLERSDPLLKAQERLEKEQPMLPFLRKIKEDLEANEEEEEAEETPMSELDSNIATLANSSLRIQNGVLWNYLKDNVSLPAWAPSTVSVT